MSSRSFGVGNYTRHVQETVDPFNQRVMAFRNDDASELEDSPENWSAEKVKAAAEMFQRNDQAYQDRIANGQNADAFLATHPEFLDTQANGELMNHELKRTFGEREYTLAEYEEAYQSLRDSNFLALNKVEVEKQRKAAAKQRAEAERTKSVEPSIDELYAMDLHELRMRANGVWNK